MRRSALTVGLLAALLAGPAWAQTDTTDTTATDTEPTTTVVVPYPQDDAATEQAAPKTTPARHATAPAKKPAARKPAAAPRTTRAVTTTATVTPAQAAPTAAERAAQAARAAAAARATARSRARSAARARRRAAAQTRRDNAAALAAATPPASVTAAAAAAAPSPASAPAAPAAPAPAAHASSRLSDLAHYDPRSDPSRVLGGAVAAFVMLEIVGGGGSLGGARGLGVPGESGGGAGRRKAKKGGKVQSGTASSLAVDLDGAAFGDRSRTWAFPGTALVDRLARAIGPTLAPRSPLAARISADAGYLRAMLGSLSTLTLLGGVVLGALAVADVHGDAMPPALGLTIAITLLGVADAAAGFAAILVFVLGVIALGGLDSAAALRTLLGLAGMWFAVPLIAGDARPLRRAAGTGAADVYDRLGDIVISSLLGAWAVQQIVKNLSGLAERELPITASANTVANAVLIALAARFLLETIALRGYPQRLRIVSPDLPAPPDRTKLLGVAIRTTIFVFVAYAVIGWCWQLVVGTIMFVIPQVLLALKVKAKGLQGYGRYIPVGITRSVLMLFVSGIYAKVVLDALKGSPAAIADAFVMLALPGLILSSVGTVVGTMDPKMSWPVRTAGAAVLVVGFLQVQGHLVTF